MHSKEMASMKSIVITGSTRGIGFGLADSFLALDCAVVVSGRTAEGVAAAVDKLGAKHAEDRIHGWPCEVTDFAQVQALWDAAMDRFGKVDIWINNAGIGHRQGPVWEESPEIVKAVVDTNLTGTIYGAIVASRGMLQQGHGSLYNMHGAGSDGRRVHGLSLYGTSKRAVAFLTQAMAREARETPLVIGAISPGMVITELITKQFEDRPEDWQRAKRIFNLIADRVETVTPWLAEKILANQKSGATISWLTPAKMMVRFLSMPFRKRDIFS
jgi:NAD(P)-dependent dehydrogenase (short-subunit alcohol dehydrogenase family)